MPVLEAEHVSVCVEDKMLLDDVSLAIETGEFIGLIGPNGAGKSTLLKTMLGLMPFSKGQIQFKDRPLSEVPVQTRGREIGYVAQGNVCHWPMTVRKVVEMGRLPYQRLFRRQTHEDIQAIENALETFDVSHLADRLVSTLSGGERARVMLARAFAGQPEILFADEPTADLDPGHQLQVMNVLKEQVRQGFTIVVVLHDLNLSSRYCDRLFLLDQGKLQAFGKVQEVVTPHHMDQAYGIEALLGRHEDQDYIVPWRLTS